MRPDLGEQGLLVSVDVLWMFYFAVVCYMSSNASPIARILVLNGVMGFAIWPVWRESAVS